MSKCTLCNERLKEGMAPACVELCPTGALSYGPLAEGDTGRDVEGFATMGIDPSIKVIPLREGGRAPESSLSETERYPGEKAPSMENSLRSEWPLAVFTFVAALLFGLATAFARGGTDANPLLFVAAALAAMAVSGAHLGRKLRAWRSLLNVAQSWLSREIAFFTLFVVTASVFLLWMPNNSLLGWAAVLIGVAALASIDMVYKFALRPSLTHSAGAFLTGVFLTGVIAAHPVLVSTAGLAKVFLYTRRKIGFARTGVHVRPVASTLRVGMGFVFPAAVWMMATDAPWGLAIAGVLFGEFVDRCEFYGELETMTPARQMAWDLERRMEGKRGQ
jgi:DMSO reductase anchor subunit